MKKFELQDSGKRQKFDSGAVRDLRENKGRYDLISPIALKRLAVVYEKGAIKYSDRNWEKGMPVCRYLDSAIRHIQQHIEGYRDEDHLGQSAFNVFGAIHTEEMIDRGLLPKQLDDKPNYLNNEGNYYYMAHPFDYRKKAREWELGIEKKLGIEIVNPFYDTGRQDTKDIDAGRLARYKIEPNKIVEGDVEWIKKSKGIIAFVTGDLSYGTIQEMVYGKNLGKPVFSVITNGHDEHPWLQYHSTKVFKKVGDLESFLENETKKNS
jgi:nucleoside 2-deoxyribosyltransferase